MFTRYTVPKNYSGSRFSTTEYETETKTHTSPNIKTSISPSFNSEKTDTPLGEINNPPFFTVSDEDAGDEAREDELCKEESEEILPSDKDTQTNEAIREFKNSALRLFENVRRDDLMLIALILLLSGEENPSIPLLLSLLLLYS